MKIEKMLVTEPGLYITTYRWGTVATGIIMQAVFLEGKLVMKPYILSDLSEPIPVRKYACKECPNKCTE